MRDDSIVDEVRQFRERRAAKFGNDLRAIAEDARTRERQSTREVVSFARREQHTRPEK